MSESPIQRRNLESEMLFLRQQHAKTLKGMHEEIKVLQKRCTDLTFKLTMQGLQTDDPSEVEAAEQKIKNLEEELESIKTNESNIAELLKKERNEIKKLEIQLKYQAIKHNQELIAKDKELNNLRSDLDSKADYIAHLSTELHKMKIQQKLEENLNLKSKEKSFHSAPVPPKNAPGSSGGRHSRRGYMQKSRSDDVEMNDGWHSPLSSSGGRSSVNSRNHALHQSSPHHIVTVQNSSSQDHMELTSSQYVNRELYQKHRHPGNGNCSTNNGSSSSSNNNNNNNPSNMAGSSSLLIKSKPTSRLLPPIRQNNNQIQGQNLQHVYVKNVVRPHCFRKQSCECNGPQLETLAVESIARFDNSWRGNHHHTKSTEYK
ncbi:Hypothetical predicted protein [Octopus vulgaris]|uniref:Uncharacterized protein n=2 Tax=Octopus TaxID=6643 RepID=A0AA36BW34_OCTVU|nr:probable serine/threonine-protein kinase DDB_G0267686 [Octopus sinensis]XP_036369374.1 probable serine/threonine-protein kinase DDB_G0267686 [Octopus sinensis]XP_036369375.1 probable serine/threonine-protein kinase DDB_G0267686 [Octopus sinensis]XP_036369376.1 probable serine/threonine-protein kinase DDB_G0267686 [Octopus sinensis]CAI9740816.1 Hypothetical predicted protein [Octopus vulgaris]